MKPRRGGGNGPEEMYEMVNRQQSRLLANEGGRFPGEAAAKLTGDHGGAAPIRNRSAQELR